MIADGSDNRAHETDSALRNLGVSTRLVVAETAQQACEAIQTGKADLLLLHHSLPDQSDTLSAVRSICADIPVILAAEAADPDLSTQAMQQGATDVVADGQLELLARVIERESRHNCTRRKLLEAKAELAELRERCELLLASSGVPIAFVHEGMHIFANNEYAQLFGYIDGDDMVGIPLLDLFAEASTELAKQQLKDFRESRSQTTFACQGATDDGEPFNAEFTFAGAHYEGEACIQVTIKPTDVLPASVRDKANEPANGGSTIEQFLHHLSRSCGDNNDRHHLLLIAQVDDFADIQRRSGIRSADLIAQAVGAELESAVGQERYSRIDNHRFAMYLSGDTEDENRNTADALRRRIEQLICEVNEKSTRVTISLVAVPCESSPSVESAMDEGFLLAIGHKGRNEVIWRQPEVEENNPASMSAQILRQVNQAIENHSFALLFQPIISLRGDEDEHYEVFLRMINDAGERISPEQFLRTAIDNGVAGKIDRWVVLQSIKMLSGHRARGHDTRITINLTSNSVADGEFAQWLSVAIKAARLPSDAVIFQVTEEDASSYIHQTREFVETLRSMHVRSSLSRYGLMASPEELLEHIPVDFVKLDGSHVRTLDSSDKDRQKVTDIIKSLQARGKLTVVPMVENAQILSTLWQAGANYIQGHYLQEPTEDMAYDFSTAD